MVWIRFALLVVAVWVPCGVNAESFTPYSKEAYPNPRTNYEGCGRSQPSWVCDPGRYFTEEQADYLDTRINGIPGIGSNYAIALAIIPRIVGLNGVPSTNITGLLQFTEYLQGNAWKGFATSLLVIAYDVYRNEVWIQGSASSLTSNCICQTIYEARQYLEKQILYTILDIYTQKFTAVLSGRSDCTTPSANVPWRLGQNGICTWDREITINSVTPKVGLPQGGTRIVILGKNLDYLDRNVRIGTLECQVQSKTAVNVTCITSPLLAGMPLDVPLPVFLVLAGGLTEYDTGQRFIYTKPSLGIISPRTTTLSGGLRLTVNGRHLDLVSFATMKTALRGKNTGIRSVSTTTCEPGSSTYMFCPTPKLDLSQVRSSRRKRDLTRRRSARAAADDDAGKEVDDVDVTVSFVLNGEETQAAGNGGSPVDISVYEDPVLFSFESQNKILTFTPIWPENEENLQIKGKGLLPALKGHEVTVQIGAGICGGMQIFDNQLHCKPPTSEPESDETHPGVQAQVGSLTFNIGYLQYYDTFWKYPPTRYALLGGGAALLLIIVAVIGCCCCTSRKKPKKTRMALPPTAAETNEYVKPVKRFR